MLLTLGAFPTYFMMSMGVGTDPLSAGLCAWIGICVMQGVARAPLAPERPAPPPVENRTAACVPRRFGRNWGAQTAG